MEPKLRHFSHKHTLILKTKLNIRSDEIVSCFGCRKQISVPYYTCDDCGYYLHNICVRLPRKLQHWRHPEHPLTLYAEEIYYCKLCYKDGKGYIYKCSKCYFSAGLDCIFKSDQLENKCHEYEYQSNPTYLSSSFQWHVHPLVLMPECKLEVSKSDDSDSSGVSGSPDDDIPSEKIICDGCSERILGPTYSCELESCDYDLHKACAELPIQMNHPMHPKHPLILSEKQLTSYGRRSCTMCGRKCDKIFYNCQECNFYVDLICASASHEVQVKCHTHPLIPIQLPSSFLCHICRTEEKGVSYKCRTCPFWVHQNCTLLPAVVKHRYHVHELALLSSIPMECHINFNYECDICLTKMTTYETIFSCVGCLFFAHPGCAMSLHFQSLLEEDPISGDLNYFEKMLLFRQGKDRKSLNILMREIREFFEKTEVEHFCHIHKLSLLDEAGEEKTCDACVLPISHRHPAYGCTICNYYLHKWCAAFVIGWHLDIYGEHNPSQIIQNPGKLDFFRCKCCLQLSNCFGFRCTDEGCDFTIDFNCVILQKIIKHKAHRHNLTRTSESMSTCTACGGESPYKMKCNSCRFILCHYCAMLPSVINHRHCKHGLGLQYSPIEKYNLDYICDFCEKALLPKHWFYHCSECELLAHPTCLTETVGGSNIKYGKRYVLRDHEHLLTLTSFMYNWSRCKVYGMDLNRGFAVGFECGTCEFKIHLKCVKSFDELPGMEK